MSAIISKQDEKLEKSVETSNNVESQYCLRWNNFQANITSQFEALRGDEDFTDVTIFCDGHRVQAHKVVLSACSPLFKDLFKSNPCQHPIIFMQDTDGSIVSALMEFMYTGEVNVGQKQLSTFLRTAKSFQIRGLANCENSAEGLCAQKECDKSNKNMQGNEGSIDNTTIIDEANSEMRKKHRLLHNDNDLISIQSADFTPKKLRSHDDDVAIVEVLQQPKVEPANIVNDPILTFAHNGNLNAMDMLPIQMGLDPPHLESFDNKYEMQVKRKASRKDVNVVRLADGIEIYEHQLASGQWNDFKKLTRGLATILFSPSELATCSVTGQRWSRARNDEQRPVKPALNRIKVHAIISYVTSKFPTVGASRIKQILAYKCKENASAFRLKTGRYFR